MSVVALTALTECIPAPTPKETATAFFVARRAGLNPTGCYSTPVLHCKTSKGQYDAFQIIRDESRTSVWMRRPRGSNYSYLGFTIRDGKYHSYSYTP